MTPRANPYESKPKHERLGSRLRVLRQGVIASILAPPKLLYGLVYGHRSRRGRWLVGLLLLVGLSAAGWWIAGWFERRAVRREVVAGWADFEKAAVGTADPDALRAALERVLAANPAEAFALSRLAAMDSGEADANDPPMTKVLVRVHARAGRRAEAAREASKALARDPSDRLARCLVADDAIRRGDVAAADEHLAALARPDTPSGRVEPFALAYSFTLLEANGRDVAALRQHIATVILPVLKGEAAATAPANVQLNLVRCYAIALSSPALPGGLAGYWAPVGRLYELALAAALEAGDVRMLGELGEAGPQLAIGLNRLAAARQVLPNERAGLASELEERTRRAWAAVKEKEPGNPLAYAGLAQSYARSRDVANTFRTLDDGLTAAPDHPRLIDLAVAACQTTGRNEQGLALAWAAAERHPADLNRWLTAARAARSADRRDKAIDALAVVRKSDPKRADAAVLTAVLWCEAGRPKQALDALSVRPDAGWTADPLTARPLAQSLAAADERSRLDAVLKAATAASAAAGTAAADGVLDAPPTPVLLEKAAAAAKAVLARWPDHAPAARSRAVALFRRLDADPTPWPKEAVEEAVGAAEVAVRTGADEDLELAAALAWLRLRGTSEPAAALSAATPLLAAEALTAAQAETAGAVLLAHSRAAEAIRLLERGRGRFDVTGGLLVQLSRAYRSAGRPAEAAVVLREAGARTLSPRERADYQAAFRAAEGKP